MIRLWKLTHPTTGRVLLRAVANANGGFPLDHLPAVRLLTPPLLVTLDGCETASDLTVHFHVTVPRRPHPRAFLSAPLAAEAVAALREGLTYTLTSALYHVSIATLRNLSKKFA